jgi:hypothetical protein
MQRQPAGKQIRGDIGGSDRARQEWSFAAAHMPHCTWSYG